MSNKLFFLYVTRNILNGKRYIGIHRTNNIDDGYLGSGTALQHAINKYGAEQFTIDTRVFLNDWDECLEFEELVVDKDIVHGKEFYNLRGGGSGGGANFGEETSWSKETRAKMSKVKLGVPRTADARRRISEGKMGKPRSEETRKKISDFAKSRPVLTCKLCHQPFKTPLPFIRHIANCNGRFEKQRSHCSSCGIAFKSSASLWKHEAECTGPPKRPWIRCPTCGITGKSRGAMNKKHFDNCKGLKPKPRFKCPHCAKVGLQEQRMQEQHFDNCKFKP